MSVRWLLEKDVFSEDLEPLKQEIVRQGHSFTEMGYIPFGGGEYEDIVGKDCTLFYGSLNLALTLSRLPCPPVIFCDRPNYECTKYYAYFGEYLLNQKYVMLPFSELRRRKDWLFDKIGENGSMFVRPSSGAKIFTGMVIQNDSFEHDYKLLGFYDVAPHAMVVVGQPHNIVREWRLVIADDEVVAGSKYHDGTLSLMYEGFPESVGELANRILSETSYRPDPVWTMDFCETKDGRVHLLEIGGFSCAGLYLCEMAPIVSNVSRIAESVFNGEYDGRVAE